MLPLDPFQRRAALDAAYRLKPDHRILLAVEAVQRFFVAGAPGTATAVREGEGWRIRLGPADVGTLSDLPDFQQVVVLVDAFAKRLAGEHPIGDTTAATADAPPEPFDWQPDAIAALREAQSRWLKGEHSPELARRACRALASLAFQDLDTLGIGDRLPAQALAMLAVTHALGAEAAREEALTAAALGYTTAAQATAMRLPEGDALRLYLENSSTLEASARGGPIAARYLQLRMLNSADDEEGEERWLKTEMAAEQHRLPVLALRLRSRHGWRSAAPQEMSLAVLLAAAEQAGDPRVPANSMDDLSVAAAALGFRGERLLETASALIGRVEPSASGPFYDADVVQSYDRSMLYSGLEQWSRTLALDSLDAATEVSRLLGQDRSPEARDFYRWLLLRIAARLPDDAAADTTAISAPQKGLSRTLERLLFDGQQEQPKKLRTLRVQLLVDPVGSLSELPSLGPAAPLQLFEELKRRFGWADVWHPPATRAVAARLDSRVHHRIRLATLNSEAVHDFALEERLMRSVFRDARSSHPSSELQFASRDGDADVLRRLALSPAIPFSLRVDAVSALGLMGKLTLPQLEDELERLGTSHPLSRKPTEALVDALTERKEYEKAVRAVRRWLAKNERRQELDDAIMHATLGRLLYRQGRYEEAWQAVEPFLGSSQGDVMRTAADVAIAMGHGDEARRILDNYVERYPDATGAARSWWLLRDYDAAAKFLARLPKPPGTTDWVRSVGKDFAEVFGPLPVEESLKATAAMQRVGIFPRAIMGLGDAMGNAGFPEHAFEIMSWLADQKPWHSDALFILRGYLYLKKWKGEKAALGWIRSGPFLEMRPNWFLVYDHRAYGLLWDLLPEPKPPEDWFAEDFWLQRTASLLLDPKLATVERRNAARQHYQDHSRYRELGKFLLGQLDERQAAKLATDPAKVCAVSYYLGLKSEIDGRFRDATAWYRFAVESGGGWEYHWAYAALQRFQSTGKTLRRLEKERAVPVAAARKD